MECQSWGEYYDLHSMSGQICLTIFKQRLIVPCNSGPTSGVIL